MSLLFLLLFHHHLLLPLFLCPAVSFCFHFAHTRPICVLPASVDCCFVAKTHNSFVRLLLHTYTPHAVFARFLPIFRCMCWTFCKFADLPCTIASSFSLFQPRILCCPFRCFSLSLSLFHSASLCLRFLALFTSMPTLLHFAEQPPFCSSCPVPSFLHRVSSRPDPTRPVDSMPFRTLLSL